MTFKKKFRGYDPQQVDAYLREKADKESRIRNAQKERIDMLADENYVLRQELKQYHADERAIAQSLVEAQQLADEVKCDAEAYSKLVLSRAKTFYATWRAYSQTLIASLTKDEVLAFNVLQKKIEDLINAYEGKNVAAEMADVEQNKEELERAIASKKEARDKVTATPSVEITAQDDEEDEPVLELDLSVFEREADDTDEQQSVNAQDKAVTDDEQDEPVMELDLSAFEREVDVTDLTVEDAVEEVEPVGVDSIADAPTNIADAADQVVAAQEEDVVVATATKEVMTNPIRKVEQASDHAIDLMELLKPEQSLEDICADLGLINNKSKKR